MGALALAVAREVVAQPRRGPGCTVSHHTLVGLDGDAVDATQAPCVATVREGALVLWRSRGGALRLAVVDAGWRLGGPARELSSEAGAFAMVETPSGAAVVYVERDRELVFARVNTRGEAQNVPRLLLRAAEELREVALVRTDVGWLVFCRDERQGVMVRALDVRGVPRGAGISVGQGRALRARWLRSQGLAVLVLEGGEGEEPTLLSMTSAGEVLARSRWPVGTAGPFELPDGLYAAQPTATGGALLLRVPPAGVMVSAPEAQLRGRFTVVAAVSDGVGVTLVQHDALTGRMLVARAGDAAVPGVVRVGGVVPVGATLDAQGSTLLLHRETNTHGARVVATTVTCRR